MQSRKHFNHRRVIVGEEQALALVNCRNCRHILIGQSKIKYVDIFRHTLLVNGLWNNGNIALEQKSQRYLRRGFSVFFAKFTENGICKEVLSASAKGPQLSC